MCISTSRSAEPRALADLSAGMACSFAISSAALTSRRFRCVARRAVAAPCHGALGARRLASAMISRPSPKRVVDRPGQGAEHRPREPGAVAAPLPSAAATLTSTPRKPGLSANSAFSRRAGQRVWQQQRARLVYGEPQVLDVVDGQVAAGGHRAAMSRRVETYTSTAGTCRLDGRRRRGPVVVGVASSALLQRGGQLGAGHGAAAGLRSATRGRFHLSTTGTPY